MSNAANSRAHLVGDRSQLAVFARGEHHVGTPGARQASGRESDAGAAADHDDGLAEEFLRVLE